MFHKETTGNVDFIVVLRHRLYGSGHGCRQEFLHQPIKSPNIQCHNVERNVLQQLILQAHAESVAKNGELVMAMDHFLLTIEPCLTRKPLEMLILL